MPISESMVQDIVQEVMAKMQIADAPTGKHGVFKEMNDAIEAAKKAELIVKKMSMDQREKIITCIRKKIKENAEVMARMGVDETGMGNVGDKILKHHLVADKTPGTEDITTTAWSGDRGLTLIEMGPFGVIGAITPCTNPSETVLCNTIGMLAGGNTVVFNPHPAAVKTSIYAINLLNEASLESGGPDNIAVTVEKPTLETSNIMMKHKDIHLIAATGGPGVVTAVLSSGKRGIGAGAGNPPALVDDTADIRKAAQDIVNGCTFDNNLPCIAEKEVVAVSSVVDELMHYMLTENDCYLASKEEQDKLTEVVNNCAGLEEKNFTADSWKVYKAAYEKAMAVLADENASQADVDAAVAALKAAYAGLVKADDGNGGNNNQGNNNQGNNNKGDNVNKPGTPNNTNAAGKNNMTNKGTVKTGDTAPFMAMIVTILAAAGVIFGTVAQKTRRRRNRK